MPSPTPPQIIEATTPAKQTTSLLGPSGTGKTHQIGTLIEAGMKTLVASTESKLSSIYHLKPKVVVIEKVDFPRNRDELQAIESDLANLVRWFRATPEHGFDALAVDSMMAYGEKLCDYLKHERRLTGYDLWGAFGEKMLKAVERLKELADPTIMKNPVHVVVTWGVEMDQDWKSRRAVLPLVDGKMVKPKLPYKFDNVLMLAKKEDMEAKKISYGMYTAGNEEFDAKVSSPVRIPMLLLDEDANLARLLRRIEEGGKNAPHGA